MADNRRVRILGVIDLRAGRAVHARGGHRDTYPLLDGRIGARTIAAGDALALAEAYRAAGVSGLYVADLDALGGRATQDASIRALAALPPPLWLDAGTAAAPEAAHAVALGASQVVVGLETLGRATALHGILGAVGPSRVTFSLDLRDGVPLFRTDYDGRTDIPAPAVAASVVAAGVRRLIVLDVARVGLGGGPDWDLLARVREAVPAAALLAGGGVRDADDLARLGALGYDGVLLATALLDGRITAGDVAHHVSR